ncbi:hypothetical protein CGRA01v4_08592 [Colletotrichum graminicola]|nr:hypothetical protein CGRA01v4_08592 [Colletotrichum graminicola]
MLWCYGMHAQRETNPVRLWSAEEPDSGRCHDVDPSGKAKNWSCTDTLPEAMASIGHRPRDLLVNMYTMY